MRIEVLGTEGPASRLVVLGRDVGRSFRYLFRLNPLPVDVRDLALRELVAHGAVELHAVVGVARDHDDVRLLARIQKRLVDLVDLVHVLHRIERHSHERRLRVPDGELRNHSPRYSIGRLSVFVRRDQTQLHGGSGDVGHDSRLGKMPVGQNHNVLERRGADVIPDLGNLDLRHEGMPLLVAQSCVAHNFLRCPQFTRQRHRHLANMELVGLVQNREVLAAVIAPDVDTLLVDVRKLVIDLLIGGFRPLVSLLHLGELLRLLLLDLGRHLLVGVVPEGLLADLDHLDPVRRLVQAHFDVAADVDAVHVYGRERQLRVVVADDGHILSLFGRLDSHDHECDVFHYFSFSINSTT